MRGRRLYYHHHPRNRLGENRWYAVLTIITPAVVFCARVFERGLEFSPRAGNGRRRAGTRSRNRTAPIYLARLAGLITPGRAKQTRDSWPATSGIDHAVDEPNKRGEERSRRA